MHATHLLDVLSILVKFHKIISKIYDKREDFNFEMVNFPHLDGDIPRATYYGVYVSQFIRFARCCTKV